MRNEQGNHTIGSSWKDLSLFHKIIVTIYSLATVVAIASMLLYFFQVSFFKEDYVLVKISTTCIGVIILTGITFIVTKSIKRNKRQLN